MEELPSRSRRLDLTGIPPGAVRRALVWSSSASGIVHRGLPSPWITVVVPFGETVVPVGIPDTGGHRVQEFRTLVGGLHDRSVLLPQDRPQAGLQLDLHPLAARALLGLPAGEIHGRVLALTDLDWPELAPELIAGLPADVVRDQILAGVRARLVAAQAPSPELTEAFRLVVAGHGRLRMPQVADLVGWSRRRLTERMRFETGLGAKELSRIARFTAAVADARTGRALADIAHRRGYADQAHLSRDWRDLAGCSPREWLGAEAPLFSSRPEPVDGSRLTA
ncbi:helix-turn-helix domain-containing protein [Nakamurella sp. YIM 132087]|uniref:Helix-turn-helix domain-containing protein n=1 Tax=Nakamurella alba TaxID=2665158 RepID=A0A7K1FGQ9_9ACTN|nr:helix-turn-helix domain-containing protein [Nakamurella alba]MTD13301.1 helix-turn-helix domain-containing protein [Nakamurella alba]